MSNQIHPVRSLFSESEALLPFFDRKDHLDVWSVGLPYHNHNLTNDDTDILTRFAVGMASVHEQGDGEVNAVFRLGAMHTGILYVTTDAETQRKTETVIDTPPFFGLHIFSVGIDPFVSALTSEDKELELPMEYEANSAFAAYVIKKANDDRVKELRRPGRILFPGNLV